MTDNWISVNERLPEHDDFVLIYHFLEADNKGVVISIGDVDIAFFNTNDNTFSAGRKKSLKVTHWQFLPNPPKEQLNEPTY